MNETFEQLLKRLSQDQTLFQSVEEATRQGVILPILDQLGWNTYNIIKTEMHFGFQLNTTAISWKLTNLMQML